MIARLGRLERLGLVARASAIEWRFRDGWAETLRGLGQAGDIVKRLHLAAPRSYPSRYVIVDGSEPLPAIEGVVRGKGLHDELSGRRRVGLPAAAAEPSATLGGPARMALSSYRSPCRSVSP